MIDLSCDIEDIHTLWDELADFSISAADVARNHLFASLCRLVQADNACWVGGVRMVEVQGRDPMYGWRLPQAHWWRSLPPQEQAAMRRETARQLEAGELDSTHQVNFRGAGTFRAHRLCDMAPPEWFEGAFYRWYYLDHGRRDCVWVCVPLNQDVEIGYGIFRNLQQPHFTERERDTLAYILRGLRWFHRQQMLASGLGVTDEPLTELERRVLTYILSGMSNKHIAGELGHSIYTTEEYTRRLYRKYGVNNRAALMALWLGQ